MARLHSCHAKRTSIGIDVLRESTDAGHGLSLCRSRISALVQVWRFAGIKFRHVAYRQVSIWLSDLRQPAHQSAAPKCHSQKLYGWPSCGDQCGVGCAGMPTHNSSQPWHSPPLPSTRTWPVCSSLRTGRHHHGVPPSPEVIRFSAKCSKIKQPRERGNGYASQCQSSWGCRVLNALYCAHQPNRAVKRTPILAMASPFYWPVLVPYAPSVLRRRLPWALGHIFKERGI